MKPTNTENPDYYHKVVDCQWACPAHTPVPEYIRLIAQAKFTESYMLNRKSNVFPGILGRTCDRPCEPACRRNRIDEEPVAICRLKRVAADLKGDISDLLPKIPQQKNGKKIAIIGSGPSALTIANDLLPLGYEVVMYEKLDKTGGLMRTNIPRFRLPLDVLDSEINSIIDMGVDLRLNSPIASLKNLLQENYDAVLIASGAPSPYKLDLPGVKEASENVHLGIHWLESVAFEHTSSIGKKVLIIGAGNTAMDCCRTARRLGGQSVSVTSRQPIEYVKASPWELEDALDENVKLITHVSPSKFILKNKKLTGVLFKKLEWSKDQNGKLVSTEVGEEIIECDDVIVAIGQGNSFPWIERDIGIDFNKYNLPEVDEVSYQSQLKQVFFAGDCAFGPKNIIWAVAQAHEAAISIDLFCKGKDVLLDRPQKGLNLITQSMGLNQWQYSNQFNDNSRQKMDSIAMEKRFVEVNSEVEVGYSSAQITAELERCLNCDVQTVFSAQMCIECDACIDICPVNCLEITENAAEDVLRDKFKVKATNLEQDIFVSSDLPQTKKVMIKDENNCIHCGLCADRCPTSAWDMQQFELLSNIAGAK